MAKEKVQETKRQKRKSWVYIMLMVNIVFILLLMTIGLIALKVGNVLPDGTDILYIVGRNPSVETGDKDKTWEVNENINIFKASYQNDKGETTVISQDGTKLIAPGVKTSYKFTMYNKGNIAVIYDVDIDFELRIGKEKQIDYYFPLQVRLLTERGNYLIGDEDEWVNVDDATLSNHVSVLGADSYETFELQLMWQFEGGNDELDTMYGDESVEKGVELTLGINTYAEEHLDPTAQGGTRINVEKNIEYGGTFRWLWLILLMLNIAIIIFYVSWLMNKRAEKW